MLLLEVGKLNFYKPRFIIKFLAQCVYNLNRTRINNISNIANIINAGPVEVINIIRLLKKLDDIVTHLVS